MQQTSPPQELEIRSIDNEQLTPTVKELMSIEDRSQFPPPLLPAQRGWGANQALLCLFREQR